MIYFDNAATTLVKPRSVYFAVNNTLRNYSANPGRSGHTLALEAATKVYECRRKVAEFFNCSKVENVVFSLNGTMALNMAIKGVAQKGDHFIISCFEHNAVARPVHALKIKGIIDYDVAPVFDDDEKTVESFKKLIRKNTRAIVCTHVSNVFGNVLPIEKIGQLARDHGIIFIVDAAQSAGILPIDVKRMNIDFLCVAPHKGLYAPMGVGILVCEKKINNTIVEGGTGTNSLQTFQPLEMPERLESGTVNVPAIYGIGAGIDYINGLGTEKIYSHEMEIIGYIYEKLKNNEKVILHTPFPKRDSFAAVIPFNLKDFKSEEVADFLNINGIAVRAGYHCAPFAHKQLGTLETGAVRVSVSAFNSKSQAEKLISVLNIKKT